MTQYLTAVGGFEEPVGGGEKRYIGPVGTQRGAVAGFAASAMFFAGGAVSGRVYGNLDSAAPISGWAIQTERIGGPYPTAEYTVTATVATIGVPTILLRALTTTRPLTVVTLVLAPGGGSELRLYVNGTTLITQVLGLINTFRPANALSTPAFGGGLIGQGTQFTGGYVLGGAYIETALSHEQVYRHQIACLEAGDMVDGSVGGAFSVLPTFTNLYSARRGNNGVGIPPAAFVAGTSASVPIGQVPPANPVWQDENGSADFTRQDVPGFPPLFTTGFKRVG